MREIVGNLAYLIGYWGSSLILFFGAAISIILVAKLTWLVFKLVWNL